MVYLGPNELSIIDASAILPVMGTNGLPKGPSKQLLMLHV